MKNKESTSHSPYGDSKWIRALLILPILLILSGCSKDHFQTDTLGEYNTRTLKHDGVKRNFKIYLPNNFDTTNPSPLVFALHGGGGTGKNLINVVTAGTLSEAAEARNVILVIPDGMDKRWNDGRPEIFGNDRMYDDIGFISTLIDIMIQDYGVDPDRVYATGISNGGLMSFRLAMDLSNKIAAIAPVTAQITEAMQSKVPEFPISLMLINGVEDPLMPYTGGCIEGPFIDDCSHGKVLSTQASIEKFKGFNQCTDAAEIEPVLDNVSNDGTSVEITRYNECEQGTEMILVKVVGGGHTWPGGAQYLSSEIVGEVSREINASEIILDFFLDHRRN